MHSSRIRTTCITGALHSPPPPQSRPLTWSRHPPGCGPGDPTGQIPFNFPLGYGTGDPPSLIPLNFPLWCGPGNLQGMLGYHPTSLEICCKACWDITCNACWDTTLPPCGQTHTCKNITFANYVTIISQQHV